MLDVFEIHEPSEVHEASSMLAHYGPNGAVYAGGTELLLVMKQGLIHYTHLINIKTIPGLDQVRLSEDGSFLDIGALVTHHRLEHDPLIREQVPILTEVAAQIANVRVRSMGTIGGNLCFAEPHSDSMTLLLALGAFIVLGSMSGNREVVVDDFVIGMFETVRREDEILTAVRIPLEATGCNIAYERFRTHERPIVTVAVALHLTNSVIDDARVAIGGVSPWPTRLHSVEELLLCELPCDEAFEAAAGEAGKIVDPVDDLYGSSNYKRHLISVMVKSALIKAAGNANRGIE